MRVLKVIGKPSPYRRLTCVPMWIGRGWFNRAPGRKLW